MMGVSDVQVTLGGEVAPISSRRFLAGTLSLSPGSSAAPELFFVPFQLVFAGFWRTTEGDAPEGLLLALSRPKAHVASRLKSANKRNIRWESKSLV